MAVFADTSLPKNLPSPLNPPKAARPQSTPKFAPPPPMIADSAVQDSVNNQLAAAAGTGRAALSGMDRAGVSRGKGQQRMADMAEASADAQARVGAAKTEMGAAAANAGARQAYENTMRGEQIANTGLLENLRQANAMERIQKQGWQQDLNEAIRRGQFGLDSIYMDQTPIINALLRQGG